jgi:TolB-like protein
MNFKATKHLLLTSAVSLVLLPSYAGLSALAQTHDSMSSVSERSFKPSLISLTQSKPMTISDVRSLYVMPFEPDSGGFRSNFIEGLKAWDRVKVVSSPAQADAVVKGAARSTGYGFWGKVSVISTKDNRVLWSGEARRRDGTGDGMAFNQLVSRLKVAASQ